MGARLTPAHGRLLAILAASPFHAVLRKSGGLGTIVGDHQIRPAAFRLALDFYEAKALDTLSS